MTDYHHQYPSTCTTTTTVIPPTTPLHQNLTCPICFELFQDAVNLVCGHSYCLTCIQQHFESEAFCPICRRATRPHHIFDNLTVRALIADLPAETANSHPNGATTTTNATSESREKEQELEDCIHVLQQTNLYLKRDLKQARQSLARSKTDLDQKQTANEVYHTIQQRLVEKLSELDGQMNKIKAEKDKQRENAKIMSGRIQQLETCNSKLMVKTRGLEDEMERLKFKSKQEQEDLQKAVSTLQASRLSLKAQLQSSAKDRRDLAAVQTQYKAKQRQWSKAHHALQQRVEQLTTTQQTALAAVAAVKDRLADAQEDNRSLRDQVGTLERDVQTQQETIHSLHVQLYRERKHRQQQQLKQQADRVARRSSKRTSPRDDDDMSSSSLSSVARGAWHVLTGHIRGILDVLYMAWVVWIIYMIGSGLGGAIYLWS